MSAVPLFFDIRPRFAMVLFIPLLAGSAWAQSAGNPVQSLLGLGQRTTAPASAATQAPSSAQSPTEAIPLPEVAARAEDLQRTLREISGQLPTADQLDQIKAALDQADGQLQERQKEVDALLAGTPNALELREELNYWRAMQNQTAGVRGQLLAWANAAQAGVQRLQAAKPGWTLTLDQNRSTPDLGPMLDLIEKSVSDLQVLSARAQDQLRTIVNLQVRAASQDQLALDTLAQLNKTREYIDGRLFDRDSLPLWQHTQRHEVGESRDLYLSATNRLVAIRVFASQLKGALIGLTILLALSLLGAYRLHVATRGERASTQERAEMLHITRHWIALGILPPLMLAYLLAPVAPLPLIGLAILVSFVPILVLLPPLVTPRFRRLLYYLAVVYAANGVIAWLGFSPALKREMQFFFNLAVFVLFALLVRASSVFSGADITIHRLRLWGVRLAIAVLGASVVSNLFGYVKLAQFLGILCVYSTFIAISLLTGVRVFTRLLLEGVDTATGQELAVVRLYRDNVVRWVPRVFQLAGTLIWLIVTLNLLGLSDWGAKIFEQILSFRIAGGGAGITFGGVLGFFTILLVGYAVSSAIRFLLREELLRRFHLSRGLPELISSTLHYLILLLIFLLAVNAGGVELNKFTVITGALGVGVGFGLQNIINNFISGLILQFERPIHIGDVLDVDGTSGKVTRIGIRSSTVKTFQGAEVIIPNGNFISGKVINWTLTNAMRRVELPIGVAYGSDVKLVSNLLNQAATAHEDVLTSPEPAVYFKEFGDSALNFELQFWVMQESNVTKVKSEVALAAMELLNQAGVEIPFPQRDLRLRAVDPTAAATLATGETQRLDDDIDLDRAKRQTAGQS